MNKLEFLQERAKRLGQTLEEHLTSIERRNWTPEQWREHQATEAANFIADLRVHQLKSEADRMRDFGIEEQHIEHLQAQGEISDHLAWLYDRTVTHAVTPEQFRCIVRYLTAGPRG